MRNSHFRIRLFFIMIVFAFVISMVGAAISYYKMKQFVYENHQYKLEQIEESVTSSIQTLEKVYLFFDKDTEEKMKRNFQYLLEKYAHNPDFNTWDFQKLKEMFNMDVYVLNDKNVITHSSFKEDIGLNFAECCPKFSKTLHERRLSGKFYADGIDISQNTGLIKKYSYQATPDKKYLFELGYSLEDRKEFQEFNFLKTIEHLVNKHSSIDEIQVINPGGYFFGEHVADMKLPKDRKKAFETALSSGKTVEIQKDGIAYRYVPYVSQYDNSETKNKVIEIVYNDDDLKAAIEKARESFQIQLAVIIIVTIAISLIISHWVSRPMYLAYHDSLTGLKNRAAYEEFLREARDMEETLAYLILDLDNFKLINDTFGHDVGDEKLKKTAEVLKQFEKEGDEIFRLGGDEFVIIIPNTTVEETEKRTQQLIDKMNAAFNKQPHQKYIPLTVSIGIAFAPMHGKNFDELYKKADEALYISKENGKGQYCIYEEKS